MCQASCKGEVRAQLVREIYGNFFEKLIYLGSGMFSQLFSCRIAPLTTYLVVLRKIFPLIYGQNRKIHHLITGFANGVAN